MNSVKEDKKDKIMTKIKSFFSRWLIIFKKFNCIHFIEIICPNKVYYKIVFYL